VTGGLAHPLAHPEWAALLLGAWALLSVLTGLALWRARRALHRIGAGALGAGAGRDAALLLALAAIALALLGPRFGTRLVEVPGNGIDVVLLLDVSRSMDAEDTPPSRLARARDAARDVLLALAPGDRAALAVFAGHGALLTPLTSDAPALVELLPALDTELMSDRGSRFARGVEAALGAFEPASQRPGVVIALGDGERAHPIAGSDLDRVRSAGVRVVAGAIGSDAGTTLVGASGPLRDAAGAPVVTRRETRGFERFAAASGGAVLRADAWGVLDAGALLAAARRGLEPGPGGTLRRELPVTHAALPAALAFALLLAELLARDLRAARRGLGRARQPAPALALLAAALLGAAAPELVALEEWVRRHPEDARALVALGVARAEAGDPEEAARAFAAAAVRARTAEDAALASYDLGVARLEAGDFAGARDAFFDALALAPHDAQAKFDLEWALRALASAPPAPPEPGDPGEEPPSPNAEREAHEPAPAPEAPPDAAPEPAPGAEAQASAPGAQEAPLAPEDVARWLDAVHDRPLPAFRALLEEGAGPRTGPQW
jgi:Ca-activated chloride channel family protein